jgi:phage terminase Nu1 subunit (DNA packaging protein)
VKSLENGVLKNHRDSLWIFRLAAEIQWLCEASRKCCFKKSLRQFKGIPPCGGNPMVL